jgi:hypothetical protein
LDEPRFPEDLPVWASLRDAFRVYRLLFQRSVLVAATVYAVIALLEIANHASSDGAATLLAVVLLLCTLAGPALVQGALIEIVRNVHEGRAPETTNRLFAGAAGRLVSLIGASFVYAFGVAIGVVLLVIPGLVVLARWSLMPAVVMLEGQGVWAARRRSSSLVRSQTLEVFMCLFISFLIVLGGSLVILGLNLGFGTETFVSFVWSSLTAPYAAHLLTVIYYRRADQGRPVIHPAVLTWRNVWEGR